MKFFVSYGTDGTITGRRKISDERKIPPEYGTLLEITRQEYDSQPEIHKKVQDGKLVDK